jgi:uncharacterized membrane protein YeaQ/YmgE (transglycosylase-associated protein family)
MIGMGFLSFLVLLAIAVVVTAAKLVIVQTTASRDLLEFFADLTFAWIGAWLGSPVFGFWFTGVQYQQVYIIPAVLGASAAVILKDWYRRHLGRA